MHIPVAVDLLADRAFGPVSIGRGTYWADSTDFQTYIPNEAITIGRYCSIGQQVTICSGGEHVMSHVTTWPIDTFVLGKPNPTRSYRRIRDTVVGSDVWIGHGAHIAGGAHVGHGAVIGARATVMKDVSPYAVMAGNPARQVRLRFPDAIVAALLEIAWWDWPGQEVIEQREFFYGPVEDFVARFARDNAPDTSKTPPGSGMIPN